LLDRIRYWEFRGQDIGIEASEYFCPEHPLLETPPGTKTHDDGTREETYTDALESSSDCADGKP